MKWVQLCGSLNILWHCPSLELKWKLTVSTPMSTAEFSRFAASLSATLITASSWRILNSSAGIPSSPRALFVVKPPKAHLTSLSKMSGSRLVTTPSWLSESLRLFFFLYSFSGVGNGNPLQYSCLENSKNRGAWQATYHGVPKCWTGLSRPACSNIYHRKM